MNPSVRARRGGTFRCFYFPAADWTSCLMRMDFSAAGGGVSWNFEIADAAGGWEGDPPEMSQKPNRSRFHSSHSN